MNPLFTVLLVAGALLAFAFILRKIRKSEISIADATFWFLFALSFVLLALFPRVAYFFSNLFGFQSPSNFVFLYVIAMLVVKQFLMTVEIAKLRNKLSTLVQEQALKKFGDEQTGGKGD